MQYANTQTASKKLFQRFSRRALVAVTGIFMAFAAQASGPVYTGLFSSKAVGGYDTVSYHQNGPVKGSKKFTHKYRGATWYFANAENLASFKQDPERYVPAYGGHCAWALAEKDALVKGDPEVWAIVDGVLYLNYDKSVQKKWNVDRPGFIKKANANWTKHQ